MIADMTECAVSPLSLPRHLPERSSPSRVRSAAQNQRALDCSGPFRRLLLDKGKGANAKAKAAAGDQFRGYSDMAQASTIAWRPSNRVVLDDRRALPRFVVLGALTNEFFRHCAPTENPLTLLTM